MRHTVFSADQNGIPVFMGRGSCNKKPMTEFDLTIIESSDCSTVANRVTSHVGRNAKHYWLCHCVCGDEVVVPTTKLTLGKRICCWVSNHPELRVGYDPMPLEMVRTYGCWRGMWRRCGSKAYADYGGRGIRVCDRWHVFENFVADMGVRPSLDHSIERRDVNGHYEPGNCEWILSSDRRQTHARRSMLNGKVSSGSCWILLLNTAYRESVCGCAWTWAGRWSGR